MPDKEGSDDEKKSTKSVVKKKQKQFMNQEDYIPEQEDSSMNVQKKKSTSELRRENEQRNVERVKKRDDKRRSDAIQAKNTFNQAAEYSTKQRPKIGGGERPDLKSKGGSASTGQSDIKIGGPKKDPKSAGGKSKGNTPVKVDIQKPETPNTLSIKKNEIQMNVYEVLENSRVYSNQNLDPNNLEIKINTKQDQLLLFEGYEVFNETECKFLQNGKQIDLTLESESSGNIQSKLLYLTDEYENFAFDLRDSEDVAHMFSQLKNHLKN